MSDKFTPIIPPDQVSINIARGLKGMVEGLVKRLPHGERVLNGGLREVVNRAIDQNPQIPAKDFTAVELAERLGIIQPVKPKRRRRA
jgi:hypothetical protein